MDGDNLSNLITAAARLGHPAVMSWATTTLTRAEASRYLGKGE